MRNDRFKMFVERVAVADAKDPIWWAGYLWIDLTKKQALKIIDVLVANGQVEETKRGYKIPSGIEILKEQGV